MKTQRKKILPVNLPDDIREWLAVEADKSCRSLSQEAAYHLKQAMEKGRANSNS
ncbi:ribbon-helix-helix domain-containing protein [Pseudomonas leptonychotis]|uniref:ribbon-helix-helix domain-containing protein n=1 Tax=Pseudomonas leptonychotis TaxID=2448482 RepID=UPI003868A55B